MSTVPRQIKTADLSAGGATSIPSGSPLSFDSNTISGNLVLIFVSNVTQKAITLSGTNKRQENSSGNLGGAVFDTVADGTTMSFQPTWTTSSRASMTIMEFDAAYTYDTSAENEANTASVVTSQAAASSAPSADAGATLGVAVFVGDLAANVDGGGTRSYTDSWAEQSWNAAASCPGIAVATKDITGGGSINTTFSVTDTGDEMWSAILSYIPDAGAASHTITPAGGISTAGAAGWKRTRALAAAGGVVMAGAVAPKHGRSFAVDGGLLLAGAAPMTPLHPVHIFNPSGGITLGGHAAMTMLPVAGLSTFALNVVRSVARRVVYPFHRNDPGDGDYLE